MKALKTLLAVGALCAMVTQANAIPITGSLSMGGEVILNGPLDTATAFTAFNGVQIVPLPAPTGSYAGLATGVLGPVTYTPFQFNPMAPSPVNPLWTFTQAGLTYTFRLDTVSVAGQSPFFLNLLGTGAANITGMDETAGRWSFTIDNPDGASTPKFDFNFISTTRVSRTPDGGMTLALLGMALMGVEGARRRFIK